MNRSALARLHVIVFIWGFTAILGKLISLQALQLVWYRLLFTIISLAVFFAAVRFKPVVHRSGLLRLLGIGAIVGAHWYCFYHAIKVSNVSITLISLSTITLFTSFLEPLFFRRRISPAEVLLALLVLTGITLIFRFEQGYYLGMFFGILSAFCGSLFVVLNAHMIKTEKAYSITFYEMIGALLLLTTMQLTGSEPLPVVLQLPGLHDLGYLLVLSVVCTAYPFVASTNLMKHLSPFTVNMITNLEPVYGILLSVLIFGNSEYMSSGFYAGTSVILFAIFLYIYLKKKQKHAPETTPEPVA